MSRRRSRAGVLGVLALTSVGCYLTTDFGDLSERSGSGTGTGTPEAGTGASDAALDVVDGAAIDAAVDAEVEFSCVSGGHWACDDFEDDAAQWPSTRWDELSVVPDAVGIRTTTRSVSPTRALELVLPDNGTPNPYARLKKTYLGTPKSGLTCSFAMFVAKHFDERAYTFNTKFTAAGAMTYALTFNLLNAATEAVERSDADGGVERYSALAPIPQNSWITVRITMQPGTSTVVSLNGAARPLTGLVEGATAMFEQVELTVGLGGATSEPWAVTLDDVYCDLF